MIDSVLLYCWQVFSIGSVISISILVGHFSIQKQFNLWLRTAMIAAWLILLTVVGVGDIWVLNVTDYCGYG